MHKLCEEELKTFDYIYVSGNGYSCLLRSILAADGYDVIKEGERKGEMADEDVERAIEDIRKQLDEYDAASEGDMLDPSDESGMTAIALLRTRGVLRKDYYLIVYKKVGQLWRKDQVGYSEEGRSVMHLRLESAHYGALVKKTSNNSDGGDSTHQ